jgi:hypothetical protein
LQDSASEVLSEENFNAHNLPVNEVEDQMSRGRIQREAFVVRPARSLWFGSSIERGAEVITTAAPVNEPKQWYLLGQIPLMLTSEKRG